MATAELTVAFGAKIDGLEVSLKRVTQQLGALQTKAEQTQKSIQSGMGGMERAWAAATTGVRGFAIAYAGLRGLSVAKDLVLAVDDINAAFNRLKAVTGASLQSAQSSFNQLRETASRTGQPLADITNQFQRFFVATASLGATNAQVQALVSTLAGFAQLSGQGPQEASAAITQLAQGLASGKLQGDELKSILENMPQLAVALARELGVSVGELRKMGEEGKLTASNVFPALLRAAAGLQRQLDGLPLTIRQAWQGLSDQFIGLVAEIDRRIGLSSYIQAFLGGLGSMVSALRTGVAGTGAGASSEDRITNLGRQASTASTQLERLQTQLQRLRSGEIVAAPGAGGTARQIADLERQAAAQVAILADRNRQIEEINSGAAAQEFTEDQQRIRAGEISRNAEAALVRRSVLESADSRLRINREYQESLTRINQAGATRLVVAAREGGNAVARVEAEIAQERLAAAVTRDRELQGAGAAGRAAAEAADVLERRRLAAARKAQREADARVENIASSAGDSLPSLIRQYTDWAEASENAQSNYETFIARIGTGTETVAVLFRAVSSEAIAAATAMERAGVDPQPAIAAMNTELARLAALLRDVPNAASQIGPAMETEQARATRALDQLKAKSELTFKEIAKQGAQAFSKDLADEIVDFATTGEAKFEEMAVNFAKMIAKMILQMLIFRAISGALGAAGVPGFSLKSAPINPDATGFAAGSDPVSRAGGSDLSPYFSGSTLPAIDAANDSAAVTVNVYNNSSNSRAETRETTDSMGNKRIEIMVEDIVKNSMASGRMDNIMQQSYGLSRPGRV